MSVPHTEAARNGAELDKTQPLIQVPGMDVAFHDCIELKHPEVQLSTLSEAIEYQFLPDMPASFLGGNSITGIHISSGSTAIDQLPL